MSDDPFEQALRREEELKARRSMAVHAHDAAGPLPREAVSSIGRSEPGASRGDEPMTRPYADLKVIDVDAHITEPNDLWTKRAPAGYEDRVPRVVTVDGAPTWSIVW